MEYCDVDDDADDDYHSTITPSPFTFTSGIEYCHADAASILGDSSFLANIVYSLYSAKSFLLSFTLVFYLFFPLFIYFVVKW